MKRFLNPKSDQWKALTERSSASYSFLEPLAKEVFDNVAQNGDRALFYYPEKFDKVKLDNFSVSLEEIESATAIVPQK